MARIPSTQQIGRAGRLFVAAELNRRGAVVSLSLTSAPWVAMIATTPDGRRTVNIQVKTKGPGSSGWQWRINLAEAAIQAPETDYMVLVDLAGEQPTYYIHHLSKIAKRSFTRHLAWLSTRGGRRPRTPDSQHVAIRMDTVAEGRDAWELLGVLP